VAAALTLAGIATAVRRDIDAVQWGKLILNLNNAVNALSDLPLKRQLADRQWRLVLAASIREAVAVLRAARIHPATLGKAPPRLLPAILELPDWLFVRVAASMLKIDDAARSSMAEDLEQGREPEIEELNGEIVRLAERSGMAAPVNHAIIAEVRNLFSTRPRRHPDANTVLRALGTK
jgi:2-dehydropantoate 2-reductase